MAKQTEVEDRLYATMDKRVVQTHIIFRHGDRAPTANYFEGGVTRNIRNHSANAETLFWQLQMPASRVCMQLNTVAPISNSTMDQLKGSKNFPYGCLTMLGVNGSIRLGEKLRKRYVSLLESLEHNSELVKARATFYTRCVQTCQSFLVGFLNCATNKQTNNPFSSGVNIFVENPERAEDLTIPNLGQLCKIKFPGAFNIFKLYTKSTAQKIRSMPEVFGPLFEYYNKSLVNDKVVIQTFDYLKTHDSHNFVRPQALTASIPKYYSLVSSTYWNFFWANSHKISAPLVKSIIENMSNRASTRTKVYLYSGHDTSVMATVTSVCKIFEAQNIFNVEDWPDYNSYVALELWCNANNEEDVYIRCVYNDEESKFLPLSKFIAKFNENEKLPLKIANL